MYSVKPTKKFQKDLKRINKRNYPIEKLTTIIKMLANDEQLPEQCCDHSLKGEYESCRECHILSDWLLIYEISGNDLILYLTRTGTHSDLFG